WCEGHHIVHWINGGQTIVENIVPLCFRHHFMVHEGGWTIEKTDVGLVFLPPAGNRVRYLRQANDFEITRRLTPSGAGGPSWVTR
ncbi:MAG: HNH endonuclease signature motif containing protein, partial [Candidatus Dormibacteria bacterium]